MFFIRRWLLLGKYRDTLNLPPLQAQTVGAMLQFADKILHPGISALYLPLEDGNPIPKDVFEKGVAFITTHYKQEKKVLISCGAGISRSVAFVMTALKETENRTLLDAYGVILKVNPKALPHPVIWQSISGFYHEEMPYSRLLRFYIQG